jgi:flagellar hook protein FlgE
MIRSLNTAVLGIKQFQTSLDTIGNNLANINTVGYKSARVDFSDTLAQVLRAPTSDTAGVQLGSGMQVSAIKNEFSQGAIKQTGVRTDLTVTGNGFFLVKNTATSEVLATRAGDFFEDVNGFLVTNDGYRVQGLNKQAPGYTDAEKTVIGDLQLDVGKYMADVTDATVSETSIFTKTGHGFTTGQQVKFTGTVPTASPAITVNTVMYVSTDSNDAANKFTLHNTASDAAAGTNVIEFNATTGEFDLTGGASISSFNVRSDGKINMLLTDGTQYTRGQVMLQNFQNPQALLKQGSNLYSNLISAGPLSEAEGTVASNSKAPGSSGLGQIIAGALELSNVDMAREFSNMITTQRAFQANARMVTTSDEILRDLMALKR